MKKNFLYIFFIAGLLFPLACQEEEEAGGVVDYTPMVVDLNGSVFTGGETITATISVNDTLLTSPRTQDLNLIVEAHESGIYSEIFEQNFPMEITLPQTSSSVSLDLNIISSITSDHNVTIWVSSESQLIYNASASVTVSPCIHITFSVNGQESMEVNEGESYSLLATLGRPGNSDIEVRFDLPDGAEDDFTDFPETVTIPAGELAAVSSEFIMTSDGGELADYRDWTISGSTSVSNYDVTDFTLTRVDTDSASEKGDKLLSELWVYDNPGAAFYQSTTGINYTEYSEDDMLMEWSSVAGEGSPHPNSSLAEEGWTLLYAVEFHGRDGWSYSRQEMDSYGVHQLAVANGFGLQNTSKVEQYCYVSYDFTDVTDEGYVRLWSCPSTGQASVAYDDSDDRNRYVGATALYQNKSMNSTMQNQVLIREGTRIEIRARLGGYLRGYNWALWLQGNMQDYTWPEYGEIDIMENPVSLSDEKNGTNTVNTVAQTLHWGVVQDETGTSGNTHANPTVESVIDPSVWNIYWVEIVDATTVKIGINGTTTRTFTAADDNYYNPNSSHSFDWPFCNEFNPAGFHFLITPGAGSDWKSLNGQYVGINYTLTASEIMQGKWMNAVVQAMDYASSIGNDDAPHMDIDWIRYWKNDNYTVEGYTGSAVNENNNLY